MTTTLTLTEAQKREVVQSAKVIKTSYSTNQWRIVSADGIGLVRDAPFDHPSLGATVISAPFAYRTKREALAALRDLRSWYGIQEDVS